MSTKLWLYRINERFYSLWYRRSLHRRRWKSSSGTEQETAGSRGNKKGLQCCVWIPVYQTLSPKPEQIDPRHEKFFVCTHSGCIKTSHHQHQEHLWGKVSHLGCVGSSKSLQGFGPLQAPVSPSSSSLFSFLAGCCLVQRDSSWLGWAVRCNESTLRTHNGDHAQTEASKNVCMQQSACSNLEVWWTGWSFFVFSAMQSIFIPNGRSWRRNVSPVLLEEGKKTWVQCSWFCVHLQQWTLYTGYKIIHPPCFVKGRRWQSIPT